MDLLTHCALGASIGYILLGKQIGRNALIWGGIGGMLPDIDVLLSFFVSPIDMLFLHRSYSHSLFFLFLFAPLWGYIAFRLMQKKTNISLYQWTNLFFLTSILHPLLDLFTTYGTGLLLPFNNGRFALSSIATIDFFFIAPFVISLPLLFFFNKISQRYKQLINVGALVLVILYVAFTVINKAHINTVFEQQLMQQHKKYAQLKTFPLMGTNLRWAVVAKTDGGYWVGKYTVMQTETISFSYISKNDYLLVDYETDPQIRVLKRFSKGMYAIEKNSKNEIIYNDLRYGYITEKGNKRFLFSYKLKIENHKVNVLQNHKISLWLRFKD